MFDVTEEHERDKIDNEIRLENLTLKQDEEVKVIEQENKSIFKNIFDVDEELLLDMLDHGGQSSNQPRLDSEGEDFESNSSLDESPLHPLGKLGSLSDKEALKYAEAINQAFFEKMEEIDNQVDEEVKQHLQKQQQT